MAEKPHARNFLYVSVLIVFLLNMLFSWIGTHVSPNFVYIAQFFTVLAEVGITSFLALNFANDSNKYRINKRVEEEQQKRSNGT